VPFRVYEVTSPSGQVTRSLDDRLRDRASAYIKCHVVRTKVGKGCSLTVLVYHLHLIDLAPGTSGISLWKVSDEVFSKT